MLRNQPSKSQYGIYLAFPTMMKDKISALILLTKKLRFVPQENVKRFLSNTDLKSIDTRKNCHERLLQ